jgi:hypothetical protein
LLRFVPVNFSQIARLFEQVIDLDTFVVTASPMAAGGSFSRGTHNDFTSVAGRRARRLIVEMNRNIPRVFGQSQIHDRDDLPVLHRHRQPPPQMTFTTELTGAPNVTDPDSRVMRTQGQPTIQGYNAQAALTGDQIIIAAEIATESPDFGHLEPVFGAALRDLKLAGMHERPRSCSRTPAAGTSARCRASSATAPKCSSHPTQASKRTRALWTGGLYDFMRRVLASEHGHEIYRQRLFSRRPRPKGSRLRSADACSILASDLVKAEVRSDLEPATASG